MGDPVIIGGARTAIGRLLGSLTGFSAADLGGFAIKGALDRAGVEPAQVEYVIMGHVLQAGAGQITSRQAAVKAGIPMTTPATTVNKVCLSGLDAIAQAADLIRLGEFDVIVAGGMESMTNAPHVLKNSRKGYKYGAVEMLDSMALDGLTDAFDGLSMGESTERHNAKLGITREEQDEFAARSQQRAARAAKDGVLGEEIVPVEINRKKRRPSSRPDEGIRPDTTAESLAKLPRVRQGRHDHGGLLVADLRRRRRPRPAARRRRSSAPRPRRGRRVRHGRGTGQRAALPAVERDQEGPRQGGPRRQRPGPHRDQRGVRRGRRRFHARARRRPRA